MDSAKAGLVRELVNKNLWHDPLALAKQIKNLAIFLDGFRPIEEAISCAGGIKREVLTNNSCNYVPIDRSFVAVETSWIGMHRRVAIY